MTDFLRHNFLYKQKIITYCKTIYYLLLIDDSFYFITLYSSIVLLN